MKFCNRVSFVIYGNCTCMHTQQLTFAQEKEDTKNQQPMEYAVMNKSKKKKKKDNKQEKVHT